MRSALILSFSSISLVLASCGGGDGGTALEWGGSEPHFTVQGFIGGRDIDIDVDATTAEIGCVREYVVPTVQGVPDESMAEYIETEVDVTFTYMGQPYTFQFEFKEHDLQNATVGGGITVVPRVDTELPAADELWLEFEWESADLTDEFEQSAQQGTVTLQLFSGTPPQGSNVIAAGEGSVGITGSAVWSASERLDFTLTAACDENDIEIIE
jgi:hypothetical protein